MISDQSVITWEHWSVKKIIEKPNRTTHRSRNRLRQVHGSINRGPDFAHAHAQKNMAETTMAQISMSIATNLTVQPVSPHFHTNNSWTTTRRCYVGHKHWLSTTMDNYQDKRAFCINIQFATCVQVNACLSRKQELFLKYNKIIIRYWRLWTARPGQKMK